MSWLDYGPLLSVVVGYLGFLFGVAWAAERSRRLQAPRLQMLTYVLAASVYCTAWTFYGSVGLAAHRGLEFLTIYLGPALVALLWPFLLRRLVRVVKEQRITSVSDFISSRYGKSAPLGALVAALVALGLIPYIALQLQAVSQSFKLILGQETILEVFDPTLLVAVVLGVFGILFGARNPDFTRIQRGLLSAVAVESVVKLLAFLTAGAYVTWGLFGGFGDIFARVLADPELSRLVTLGSPPAASFARWGALLFISMMAVMFLPRQFHVLVVQNQAESHVRAAAWLFPLYLFLINLFVLPIAFAGLMLLPREQADHFVLLLPLSAGVPELAVLVFLGGFSAATAMIVVDSLAISKMLTNDIVVPILLRYRSGDIYRASLHSMRLSIIVVVFLGYVWAMMAGGHFLLVEMGLLSFVAVTQCAPAILLGLAWPRGNRRGAFAGLSAGFGLWFYTLIVPALVKEGFVSPAILSDGPLGLAWLRPTALFGLDGLDSVSHGLFWSLLVNLTAFVLVSLATRQDAEERLQAAAFTGRFPAEDGPSIGRSILSPPEIERLIHHYVGGSEAAALARELLGDEPARERSAPELLGLRIRLEKRLAASLGAAAARFIVEDRFALSTGQAEQLVESFQELQHSLRTTEEEVRRTEHLLASVVRSVDDCIFTTDPDGRLLTINPAGQRLLEAAEAELAGAPWWELLAGGERSRLDGDDRAAGAWRGWKGEVRARARGDREFPAHLALTPILDRRGHVLGVGGGAPRPHRAAGAAATAHPAGEARLAGPDGGRRRSRDPQPPGGHQDRDGGAPGLRRPGRPHPGDDRERAVGDRRDRVDHQPAPRLHARDAARPPALRPGACPRPGGPGVRRGGPGPRRDPQSPGVPQRDRGPGGRPEDPPGLHQHHPERGRGDRAAGRASGHPLRGPRRPGGRRGHRQRRRPHPGGPREDVRAVLHHQAHRHGPRPGHREEDRGAARRGDPGGLRAGARHAGPGHPARRSAG